MSALPGPAALVETFFPALCPICFEPLAGNITGMCTRCRSQLLPLGGETCPLCGRPSAGMERFCASCLDSPPPAMDGGVIWGEYQGVLRAAIIALKHRGVDQLAPILAERMAALLVTMPWISDIEILTPVPSHLWYKIRRGYSTAPILSREVAGILGLQYSELLRRRGLSRQMARSRAQRMTLKKKSFSLKPGVDIRGRTVLVLDDVMTTGSTIDRIAGILRHGGAKHVYSAALAWPSPSGGWG